MMKSAGSDIWSDVGLKINMSNTVVCGYHYQLSYVVLGRNEKAIVWVAKER